MIEEDQGITFESIKGKDFGKLPIEHCDFNNPQLPRRMIAYIEEGALHCGQCNQCKKQGHPACGIYASNQCPDAGQQDIWMDETNVNLYLLSAHARKSSS